MLVRDDEDLAVDQLPPVPQAGRPDDPRLRSTGAPMQERGAESATPAPAGRRELRRQTAELAQLQAQLAGAPRWLHDTLGEPPPAAPRREEWDRAARVLARYRVDQDLDNDVPGIGPEPDHPDKRRGWQRVSADLTRAQRRLGREHTLDRGRGRGRGLERD